jgi:hypothetical protein
VDSSPEYQLRFTEQGLGGRDEQQQRRQTLDELTTIIHSMRDRPLAVVSLDELQSDQWDQEGGVDYQNHYGQAIIDQVADGETETLVINNVWGLPVALSIRDDDGRWQGLGVDPRLREEIEATLGQVLG